MTTATDHPHAPAPNRDALSAWLMGLPEFTVVTKRDHDGRWFALVEEFDITGMGDSEDAALKDMLGLLSAYLLAHFEDGTPFEETRRPIPRRLKLEIRAGSLMLHGVQRLAHRERGRERKMLYPPEFLQATAAC